MTSKHAPSSLAKQERAQQAFDLRIQGLSMREIGDRLGVHYSTVSRDIDSYMDTIIVPKAETYRAVYNARYEKMLAKLNTKISDGDVDSINCAARLLASMSKLNGIDSPTKSEKQITVVTPADIEIRAMIEAMQQQNEATRAELA